MEWQRSVRLEDTLVAVEQAMRTLDTAVEWHRLAVPARIAKIEFVAAWAVESDNLV